MRARVVMVLVSFAAVAVGCTAFVAGELAGKEGSGPALGDCFNLTNNQCGQCIATSCEDPTGSPPVSLKTLCQLTTYSEYVNATTECVKSPDIQNDYCGFVYVDGGSYATNIDTQSAAENNLRKCITDHCVTSCSACGISVPTCGNDSVTLVEAGTCGQCFDNAMNAPGSPCQPYVLQGGCAEYSKNPVGACAIPPGQCQNADCSGVSSPSTNLDDAGYGLFSCLWQQCQGACPQN